MLSSPDGKETTTMGGMETHGGNRDKVQYSLLIPVPAPCGEGVGTCLKDSAGRGQLQK